MAQGAVSLSVVIPARNEQQHIASTVTAVHDFLAAQGWQGEVIVVDDGSSDRTAATAAAAGATVIENNTNYGKGYSIRRGVAAAQHQLICFMDADQSTPVGELAKLVAAADDQSIVIGSRTASDASIEKPQPLVKRLLGKSGNVLIRWALGLPMTDTQCGFKLFPATHKAIVAQTRLNRWGFDFELLYIAQRHSLPIKQIGVRWLHDEQSAVTVWGYANTLLDIARVRINTVKGLYD